jgi:hypothetical protein
MIGETRSPRRRAKSKSHASTGSTLAARSARLGAKPPRNRSRDSGIRRISGSMLGLAQRRIEPRAVTQTQAAVTRIALTQLGVTQLGVTQLGVTQLGVTQLGVTPSAVTRIAVTQPAVTPSAVTQCTPKSLAQPRARANEQHSSQHSGRPGGSARNPLRVKELGDRLAYPWVRSVPPSTFVDPSAPLR